MSMLKRECGFNNIKKKGLIKMDEFGLTGITIDLERDVWVIKQRGRYWNTDRNAWVVTFWGATKSESESAARLCTKLPNFYSF